MSECRNYEKAAQDRQQTPADVVATAMRQQTRQVRRLAGQLRGATASEAHEIRAAKASCDESMRVLQKLAKRVKGGAA